MNLDAHFFRRESGRMVAALTRIFGLHDIALAEDVAQDAICRALEVWGVRGLPDNPAAWLMTTAKNRAIDVVRQRRTARTFAPELARLLETEEAFADRTIEGEQLRMMFSCCHPKVPEEAQIALMLSILCGFGPGEIAAAFLTSVAAIEKRLSRGKHALAESKTLFDLDAVDFDARLSTVQRALYLLFNEGYHGSLEGVRAELCHEAMRLTALLRAHPRASTPTTNALASLMCLHAARLPARVDAAGDLATLVDQDRSRWDARLLAEGLALLESSASGTSLSAYHLEAAIAAIHAAAPSIDATDWPAIVSLYDKLMECAPSPVIALSRAIAIGQAEGPARGLEALDAIADRDRLAAYPFLPAARGTFELKRGRLREARVCFEQALVLARNPTERRFLEKRLAKLWTELSPRAMAPIAGPRPCVSAHIAFSAQMRDRDDVKKTKKRTSTTPAIDRLIAAIPRGADPAKMREALAMKDRAQELARTLRASRSLPVLHEVSAETGHRVDAAIAAVLVMSPTKPDCARGCAYCCHIHVTVRAPEVFRALDLVREKMPDKLDAIATRAAANAARIQESTTYPRTPCAFLENGACLVYDARPVLCRTEHSYDAAACRRIFETGVSEKVTRNSDLSGKAALALIPFGQAVDAVFVGHGIELQQAIHIALTVPDAASRWLAGEDVFEEAAVEGNDAW